MGKGKRNQDQRKLEQLKVQCILGMKKSDLPKIKTSVPVLSNQYMTEVNAIKEAQQAPAKALRKELATQLRENHEFFARNEIGCILYALHKVTGMGYYQLLHFVHEYQPVCKELTDFYEHEYNDTQCLPLFNEALKRETGIDISILDKQIHEIFDPGSTVTPRTRKFKYKYEPEVKK